MRINKRAHKVIFHTTRGLIESDMEDLVAWMDEAIVNYEDESVLEKIGAAVKEKMSKYPLVA